jgi:peroxiredoxin
MAIAAELNSVYTNFHANGPKPITTVIKKTTDDFIATFNPANAIQVGDKLPAFKLSDATGKEVDSADLLANGPLLINFYRGNWCPFCNIALKGYQDKLEEITAKGAIFIAISPELPDESLTTKEKLELKFTVLSDKGNVFAKKLGILFQQPEEMKSVLGTLGVDFKARNGDDSLVVPVPATILVDKSGIVRNTFIDPDYAHRLEPSTAVEWIGAL